MRGNPVRATMPLSRMGSIPACAGEPVQPAMLSIQGQVYPRVCGGTELNVNDGARLGGLSPRVRGNLEAAATPK